MEKMFSEFDFEILNDSDFKEDAVREELIAPIIKKLGYSVNGDSRIIRSKALVHPYVAIGSQQKKVSIIPDYIFTSDNKPYWILEAKSPSETILKGKHNEQAYSYAIHPEVRAELFALCNGKEFVLYSIRKFEPVIHFKLKDINNHWNALYRILNPAIKANTELLDYHPDFGLHLHRLGVEAGLLFIAVAVNCNHIAKVEDDLYTTMTVIDDYVISLDFNYQQLMELFKLVPKDLSEKISNALKRQPFQIHLTDEEIQFGVVAKLKDEIMHNAEESYIPF
jgi:hypothetical protein